jgi:hypothetical protein
MKMPRSYLDLAIILMPLGDLPLQVSEIGFGTSQLANTDNHYIGKDIFLLPAQEIYWNEL